MAPARKTSYNVNINKFNTIKIKKLTHSLNSGCTANICCLYVAASRLLPIFHLRTAINITGTTVPPSCILLLCFVATHVYEAEALASRLHQLEFALIFSELLLVLDSGLIVVFDNSTTKFRSMVPITLLVLSMGLGVLLIGDINSDSIFAEMHS